MSPKDRDVYVPKTPPKGVAVVARIETVPRGQFDDAPKTGVEGQSPAEIQAIRQERTPDEHWESLYAAKDDHGKRIGALEVAVAGVGGDVRGLGGMVHGLGGKVDTLSQFVGTLNTTLQQHQQINTVVQVEAAKAPNLNRERNNKLLAIAAAVVTFALGLITYHFGWGGGAH